MLPVQRLDHRGIRICDPDRATRIDEYPEFRLITDGDFGACHLPREDLEKTVKEERL